MKTKITISLGICLFISGCSSITVRTAEPDRIVEEGIYPGVRANAWLFSVYSYFWTPIFLVDLAFSAAADTVCLPYDLLKKKDTEKEPNQQVKPPVKTPSDEVEVQGTQPHP